MSFTGLLPSITGVAAGLALVQASVSFESYPVLAGGIALATLGLASFGGSSPKVPQRASPS